MIEHLIALEKLRRRESLVFAINKREYLFLRDYGRAAAFLHNGKKSILSSLKLKIYNKRLFLCYRRITPIVMAVYFLRSHHIKFKWDTSKWSEERGIVKIVLVYL